jgi:hypothetical protein
MACVSGLEVAILEMLENANVAGFSKKKETKKSSSSSSRMEEVVEIDGSL